MKDKIEDLINLLDPIAEKHTTLDYMYWVTESINGRKLSNENMTEHGSMEEYCERCIDAAIDRKHREWAIDRNVLMGQIFEADRKGYYTYLGYSNARSKYIFRKVRVNKKHIDGMKQRLEKEYRVGHKFSKDGQMLIMQESEGFRFCEGCGKMFDTSLLLNEQELEHWEGLEDNYFKSLEPSHAYELIAILREGGCETHKLKGRVEALANRIIEIIRLKEEGAL